MAGTVLAVVSARKSMAVLGFVQRAGAIRPSDMKDLGLDPRLLSRLVAAGSLVRLRHGLYVIPGQVGQFPIRDLACQLSAAVSHQSAAEVYGFTRRDARGRSRAGPGHLTTVGWVKGSENVVVHHTRHLAAGEVREFDGCPVTSPARTLVDLCAPKYGLSDDEIVEFFDHLMARRLLTIGVLAGYLRSAPRRPGTKRLRRLVGDIAGDNVESVAERRLLRVLVSAGLAPPVNQFRLCDSDGRFVARLDHAWPDARVALEVDGYRYHSGTRVFRYDRERGNRIQSEGWMLLRTTPSEIAEGAATLVTALRSCLKCRL